MGNSLLRGINVKDIIEMGLLVPKNEIFHFNVSTRDPKAEKGQTFENKDDLKNPSVAC